MDLLYKILFVIPAILLSFVVHEMCHAYAAYLFGDPTPKFDGRLSPDPRKHIDPFGAALIVILLLIGSRFIFGWAKPVSVNANNFKNPRQDMAWVAFAGPLSNFAMAAAVGMLLKFGVVSAGTLFGQFIVVFVMVNLGLGIFNMIPFPPLDGSKIIYGILPSDIAYKLMAMEMKYARFVPFVLIILILSGLLDPIIGYPYAFLFRVFTGLNI
ncbi:MAG: site-2 protease family protein [Candidatus Eremiobacteraeota bacterium]|nr:site-2 protease family protein [Candidatus Eremiobacteraeota bacterium]